MGIITAERIAELIEEAPGWALVALTMPQEGLRVAMRWRSTSTAPSIRPHRSTRVRSWPCRCRRATAGSFW